MEAKPVKKYVFTSLIRGHSELETGLFPPPIKKISMIYIALKNRTTANTRPYMDENLNRAPQIQHINSKISKHLKTHFLTLNPQTDVLLFDHYLHYGI